jgi:hypothetical protein
LAENEELEQTRREPSAQTTPHASTNPVPFFEDVTSVSVTSGQSEMESPSALLAENELESQTKWSVLPHSSPPPPPGPRPFDEHEESETWSERSPEQEMPSAPLSTQRIASTDAVRVRDTSLTEIPAPPFDRHDPSAHRTCPFDDERPEPALSERSQRSIDASADCIRTPCPTFRVDEQLDILHRTGTFGGHAAKKPLPPFPEAEQKSQLMLFPLFVESLTNEIWNPSPTLLLEEQRRKSEDMERDWERSTERRTPSPPLRAVSMSSKS